MIRHSVSYHRIGERQFRPWVVLRGVLAEVSQARQAHVASRRIVAALFLGLLLALSLAMPGWAQSRPASPVTPASLVVTNAKIMTMDSRYPRAEAIAVSGEWVIAIGTVADIEPYIGPQTKVLDVGGRLVLPGFNDSHTHFLSGSRTLRELYLYGVNRLEEVLRLVGERVAKAKPGEWITGSGYDHTLWGTKWPTKEDLDRVAPNNPVVLRRVSGHSVWVNSLALKLSGITNDTPDPAGGEIQKYPKTGEPTGILLETAAGLIKVDRPRLSPEETRQLMKDDLSAGFRHAAKLGVTSVQTSSSLEELAVVRELKAEGKLTLRWNGWLPLRAASELVAQGIRSGHGDYWVRFGFLKGYIDGTVGDRTAAMFEPFADRPGFTGLPRLTQEELSEAVAFADRNGFQVGIHAIGDRGIHMALNAFERAAIINGATNQRHRVEHAQLVAKYDIRRFGPLGVVASMQQVHCTTDLRYVEARVGYERAKTAYPWRSLLAAGVVLAFGTDWPVEPLDPMRGIFSSLTRMNIETREPKTGWFPEQKLTLWESIYYYTWGSAYGEHLESVKGVLVPGRLADMIVLDRDLFTSALEEILQAKVDYTIVGGQVVWDRAANRWGPENQ